MSQAVDPDPLLGTIVTKEVARVVRNSTILYSVNAVIIILGTRLLTIIFNPYFSGGLLDRVLELFSAGIAIYALTIYVQSRRRQSKNLATHLYILGVSGLCVGTLFFAWGAIQYLSAGYWLRQYYSDNSVAGRNGGEVAVYGTDKLVNIRTSKLVRIGYSIPRTWTYAGIVLIIVGIVFYAQVAFSGPILGYNIGSPFLIDGLALLISWYTEKMYSGGRISIDPAPAKT